MALHMPSLDQLARFAYGAAADRELVPLYEVRDSIGLTIVVNMSNGRTVFHPGLQRVVTPHGMAVYMSPEQP